MHHTVGLNLGVPNTILKSNLVRKMSK